MTGSYKFIDHTADIVFEVEGKTIEELFNTASIAWKEAVLETERRLNASGKNELSINAASLEQLVVDFLSELNY